GRADDQRRPAGVRAGSPLRAAAPQPDSVSAQGGALDPPGRRRDQRALPPQAVGGPGMLLDLVVERVAHDLAVPVPRVRTFTAQALQVAGAGALHHEPTSRHRAVLVRPAVLEDEAPSQAADVSDDALQSGEAGEAVVG